MADREWPHDPDDEQGSEGRRKYDMAILAKKVEDVEFPLSKETFLEEHANEPVRVNHDRIVSVADIFEYVEPEEFEDVLAFHRAVGDAMRAGDFWDYHPVGADPERKRA